MQRQRRARSKADDARTHQAGTANDLEDVRARTERLLTVGAEAIAQALSGDSRAFLGANRQEGGQ